MVPSYLIGISQAVEIGCHSFNSKFSWLDSSCLAIYWCTSRLCPWFTLVLHLHFPNCSHCTGPWHPTTIVSRAVLLCPNSMATRVTAPEACLESLQAWFYANSMTLNAVKSNAILATSQWSRENTWELCLIPASLFEHTRAISTRFYHIRAVVLSDIFVVRLIIQLYVQSLSPLSWTIQALYGIPAKSRLQRTQNTLAAIILHKLRDMVAPEFVTRWIYSFTHRQQRVKIDDTY